MKHFRQGSIILAVLLCFCACRPQAVPQAAAPSPPRLDDTPRIAVISAFELEFNALLDLASPDKAYEMQGRLVYTAELGGQPVVLAASGVSMVNAAMTTQWLLDHFDIQAVVVSGIAGGANPQLAVGDVVVPARWAQYQEAVFARETGDGWDTAWYGDDYGNFGMIFPQPVEAHSPEGQKSIFWFDVDPALLEAARQAAETVNLDRCTYLVVCLEEEPRVEIGGSGVSGQAFINNKSYREWVWNSLAASAMDMESAAVAQVAYSNQVPFIAFRALSDLAGGEEGDNQMLLYMKLAAKNSASLVEQFLIAWGETQPVGVNGGGSS
ncbi:5'-methylthioadenosine/S-adenosylhomocysteine nucleosidase [Ornatilinea apprima]|uniref:5'-methylthioadenosine/S-adenosylhomocysteine nucleosidase n=1 Tax=Ornatilinea apprima TaxID=1134406 RepID=UPI0009EA08F3|nr:5'-methylthioadenosine/S-adenosylhomocysteine nucleosidase [Ornatilinea apprima]